MLIAVTVCLRAGVTVFVSTVCRCGLDLDLGHVHFISQNNKLKVMLIPTLSCSIVMTVISTALAFVLMPLNIYIYTRFWAEELAESAISGSPFNVVPYQKIATALASALGPVILGALIRKWNVKVANVFAKVSCDNILKFCFKSNY